MTYAIQKVYFGTYIEELAIYREPIFLGPLCF